MKKEGEEARAFYAELAKRIGHVPLAALRAEEEAYEKKWLGARHPREAAQAKKALEAALPP